ncbi:porin family protein [uncultured Sunxiuqinia sp.]|uniref:type IX secretion/gliding motility protein PorT/SprT n=1 Tax=Sunxiuqinia rutila TaxID=1397841 RepID=UPI00260ABB38|nr:porin family protein [uncultured Sunxiuqinia sp.]
MKKLISIIILLYLSASAFAQHQRVKNLTTFDDKKLHFGFTIAINTLDFSMEHYRPIGNNPDFVFEDWQNVDGHEITAQDTVFADIAQPIPGLTVGIVSNLRLGEYFDLRFLPGLSFGERRLVYNVPVYDISNVSSEALEFYSIKSTYIDLPLLVKYKSSRLNNQRPYLIAGPAMRIDISKTGKEDLVRVKRGGFYFEAGVGWDSYLPFFRLSTELKVSLGLGNMLNDGPDETQRQYYTSAIKKLTSNVFTLSFHFE